MSDKKIKLKIISPSKTVMDKEVDFISAKGINGEFGILPDHVPFMSALDVGVAKVIQEGKEELVSVIGGVFQLKDNEATVLTKAAELDVDIDIVRAKEAKERAEARLGSLTPGDEEYDKQQMALLRAITRLKAAKSL